MAGQFVKDAVIPKSKIEGLVSYAPEPIFAAMQMAALPDGTLLAIDCWLFEDLGIGMLAQALVVHRCNAGKQAAREIQPDRRGCRLPGDVGANIAINFALVRRSIGSGAAGAEQAAAAEAQQQMREQERSSHYCNQAC